jgi:cell division protein FtsZ
MQGSGKAIMGAGIASGPDRAINAVEMALNSPLLDDTDIKGASNVLLYITSGKNEISLEELNEITGYITNRTGEDANVIWGDGVDDNLDDEISITLIATGFNKPVVITHTLNGVKNTLYEPAVAKAESITEVQLMVEPVVLSKPLTEPVKIMPEVSVNNTGYTLFTENSAEKKDVSQEKEIQKPEPFEVKSFFHQEPELEIIMPVTMPEAKAPVHAFRSTEIQEKEQEEKSQDRINKLKNLSHKPISASNVEEMERVPAYMRRNVDLPDASQLNESTVSRYTLSTDNNNKTGLRENNSFLHDNVD